MSHQFNDTSTGTGLVQLYELEIGADATTVSGNTTKLKQFAAATRVAFDNFFQIALPASGTWQLDDSNYVTNAGDYPIISTNLVANQRDYPFTSDEFGNLVLDIYKVLIANSSGRFSEVKPVDTQSESDTAGFWDGQNQTGTPHRYDKTANGIFLDPIPSYNYTNGLKAYVNREPSYFVYTDTSKKPGVPGLFHSYFYLKPAADYLRRHGSTNDFNKTMNEVLRLEAAIVKHFSERPRDEVRRMAPLYENNH